MKITGKTYDVLKFIAQIGLPALGTLYVTLAGVWGLPSAEEVVSTIVAIDTFLGVVLQISSANFNVAKGTLEVLPSADGSGKTFSLNLDGDPEKDLEVADKAVFEIKKS